MPRKGKSVKKASVKKKSLVQFNGTQVPPDTYEEWLRKQVVKPTLEKPEVQIPLNSYEEWIRRQVKVRVSEPL